MPNVERKSANTDQCPTVQGDGFPRDTSTKAETQGTDKTHDISLPTDLSPILPHCGSLNLFLNPVEGGRHFELGI